MVFPRTRVTRVRATCLTWTKHARPSRRRKLTRLGCCRHEDSDDEELKPTSDSDEESGSSSDTSIKSKDLPVVRPFSQAQERKRKNKEKRKPLSKRQLRRREALTVAFLMKTIDNTHVRLVKYQTTAYLIFQFICKKYEGAAFQGDPYFIQHYLMEIKYEEGSDLMKFFLKLENAIECRARSHRLGDD
ncbi:hypothetical protein Pcac1_g20661 [Phytophthora cactorum]|nr:hypothetical protein Pcac1_g20661 [Phytophthora cactorum]